MATAIKDLIEVLKEDYQRFPFNQTYSIYAADVYFKDPLNEFRGVKRYQKMIDFMSNWFSDVKMDLWEIKPVEDKIETRWTLHWRSPLPWRPPIAISGRSELGVNNQNLIMSHIDYWDCSHWDVVKQHFS